MKREGGGCYTRRGRGGKDRKRNSIAEMPVSDAAVTLRSNKRTRQGVSPFQGLSQKSFDSVSRTNLSAEAGVKPLSPEKKRKKAICLRESHGEYTPEISKQECDLKNVYFPVQSFPESFFVFKTYKVKGQEPEEDVFNRLPDEMILRVLHWVPRNSLGVVAKVNRRLNRLSQDESLWKRVDAVGRTLSNNHLSIILSRKPIYARFAQTAMMSLHPDFKESCNQLTHLDLSMAQVSPNILAQLFSNAPNISHLSLEHLNLNDDAVTAMETFSRSIQVLNLAMSYDISAVPFADFLTKTSKLEQLNISNMKQNWSNDDLTNVVSCLPSSLDQLNISGFRVLMKDPHIEILTQQCNALSHLDLSDCQDLTEKSVELIVLEIKCIKHLALSRCYNIEPSGYHHLQHAKSLRSLQLFTLFKDSSLRTLNATFPGVQINSCLFSVVARPTVGLKRSSIWDKRVRD